MEEGKRRRRTRGGDARQWKGKEQGEKKLGEDVKIQKQSKRTKIMEGEKYRWSRKEEEVKTSVGGLTSGQTGEGSVDIQVLGHLLPQALEGSVRTTRGHE